MNNSFITLSGRFHCKYKLHFNYVFEFNLVSESSEPVRKTSLNVSFTNFCYAQFFESFIFVCESSEAVEQN